LQSRKPGVSLKRVKCFLRSGWMNTTKKVTSTYKRFWFQLAAEIRNSRFLRYQLSQTKFEESKGTTNALVVMRLYHLQLIICRVQVPRVVCQERAVLGFLIAFN
jgi:hypothetical protein